MKRSLFAILLVLTALSGLIRPGPAHADVFDPKDYFEVVVQVDSTIDPEAYATFFLQQLGVTAMSFDTQRVSHVYKYAITGFSVYLTADEFAKAQRLDLLGVESITKSEKVSVNPITNVDGMIPEGHVADGAQVIPTGIQRIGALPNGKDYSSVDVAVIDTGVDRKHPDLNVVGGVDCVSAYGDQPDYGFDGYGHGTHVAGTIAARDNGLGVVGVAPGARIWSVKVLGNDGSGSYASVICGLDWVAENAATIEVANMSLGGGGYPSACGDHTDPLHDAVCAVDQLGTTVVVAAGNSSADAAGFSPSNYKEVVTVSAFADFDGQPGGAGIAPQDRCYGYSVDDELAAYSNYGADVDISAPGTCILSTLPTDTNEYGVAVPNYGTISGTSMATPMVTGCFARYLAANPDQRQFAREQILTYSESKTDPIMGDHDQIHEPLLYCDNVPRHESSGKEFNG